MQKNKSWGLAPSLGIGMGKPTQLTLNFSHMQQNNIPDFGIPTLLPDTAIAAGITVNDLNFSNFYSIASRDYEDTTSDIVTGNAGPPVQPMFTLRNLTRYGKNYRDAVLHAAAPRDHATAGQGPDDPGYNPAVSQMRRTDTKYQHRNDRVTTNQTDLSSTFRPAASRTAPTSASSSRTTISRPTRSPTSSPTGGRRSIDLFNPDAVRRLHAGATSRPARRRRRTPIRRRSTCSTPCKLNDQWQADLGMRWDRVEDRLHDACRRHGRHRRTTRSAATTTR